MPATGLSRRERQIMDIVYQRGQASALEIQQAMTHPPGYSAVRALLRILEDKGHLTHRKEGARFIYLPVQTRQNAARNALAQVVHTFFGGSIERTVATLLSEAESHLEEAELDRLTDLIAQAKSREENAGEEHHE